MRSALRPLRVFFACVLALAPAILFGRFSETLSPGELTQCGLSHLTADQVACIDALVQRELAFAKQGRTKAFAKSFTQRRTDTEQAVTGLATLSEAEKTALDLQVAGRIAAIPAGPGTVASAGGTVSATLPKPRAALEVHGSVTLMVGGSSGGGSFYGGAVETTLSDPAGRYAISLGYSEVHGKGMGCLGLYPWEDDYYYYDYGYGCRPVVVQPEVSASARPAAVPAAQGGHSVMRRR